MRLPLVLSSLCLLVILGCSSRKDPTPVQALRKYEHGLFIVCEGNFGWGESALFYYDTSSARAHVEDVYKAANGFSVGNVLNSLCRVGSDWLLVINNSNKVERIDGLNVQRKALQAGLVSPRYAIPVGGDRVLVTDLYSGSIEILNAQSLAIEGFIKAPGWTEQMVKVGGQIWIANRRPTSLFSDRVNEQVLVLDTASLHIVDSIKVKGRGLDEILLSSGNEVVGSLEQDSTLTDAPAFCWINRNSREVRSQSTRAINNQQAKKLQKVGDWLYFLKGDALCWMPSGGGTVEMLKPFGPGANLTTLLCLPSRNNTIEVFVANAGNFTQKGILLRGILDPVSGTFQEVDRTTIGVIPGNAYAF